MDGPMSSMALSNLLFPIVHGIIKRRESLHLRGNFISNRTYNFQLSFDSAKFLKEVSIP